MTMANQQTTIDTMPSSARKKRKMMIPTSPVGHEATNRYSMETSNLHIPSIPSFSKIKDMYCPHRRTESVGFDFSDSVTDQNRTNDASMESFLHKEPRLPLSTKETDTFAKFASAATSTFGTSSSFIGLQGLIPEVEDNEPEREAQAIEENKITRKDSDVGLNLDYRPSNVNINMDNLSHPLSEMPHLKSSGSGLEIPKLDC